MFDDYCYTLSDKSYRVAYLLSGETWSELDNWLPYRSFDGKIYVDPTLTSSPSSCGLSTLPCASINGAMQSLLYGLSTFTGVLLMSGTHSKDTSLIDIGTESVSIQEHQIHFSPSQHHSVHLPLSSQSVPVNSLSPASHSHSLGHSLIPCSTLHQQEHSHSLHSHSPPRHPTLTLHPF